MLVAAPLYAFLLVPMGSAAQADAGLGGAAAARALAPLDAAAAPAARQAVAIVYGTDAALCANLPRLCELWHDAGTFALGAASADEQACLRARGAELVAFDAPHDDEQLYLVHAHERLDGHDELELPRGARVLLATRERVLFAWPSASAAAASPDELARLARFAHCGARHIERRALPPVAEFRFRGRGGQDTLLALGGADPRVSALVAQVDAANIQAKDQALASNFTRRADQSGAVAAQNQIAGWLSGFGYAPQLQTFSSTYSKNVMVEIPGALDPSRIVVLGAHYDSINQSGATLAAPGADDNASGSAALLELARVLKTAPPFEHTLRLYWFSAEEFGLLGSDAAAAAAQASSADVAAMLNMDMVAYRKPGDTRDCDFATNSTSAALTDFADATSALYVSGWASKKGVLGAGSSDHAAFTNHGFPAAFFFEDLVDFYPSIHTANDTNALSTNDWQLAQMIASGVLATAATLAEPVDLAIAHTPLADTQDGVGPYLVAATITSLTASPVASATLWSSSDGGASWTQSSMSASGSTWSGLIASAGSPKQLAYWIEAFDQAGNREVAPAGADSGAGAYSFFVGTQTVLYANGFEAAGDDGWTHGALSGTDDWQRGAPQGKAGDPSSAFAGAKVWGNDLGASSFNGEYPANAHNWLRSPSIDCSSASNVRVAFRRYLRVEDALFDQAQVWVNGAKVWENASSAGGTNHTLDGAWQAFELDVSAQAALQANTRVEFRLKSDGGLQFGGWNLDEFRVVSVGPAPPPGPPSFALAPASAAAIGGQTITASGSGLGGVSSVTVASQAVAFAQGAGQVTFALPQQGALGATPVVITTAAGSGGASLSVLETIPPALHAPATHATGQALSVAVGAHPSAFAWLLVSSQSGATSIPGLVELEIGNGNLLDLHVLAQHGLSSAGTWTFALPVPSGTGLAGVQVWLETLLLDPLNGTLASTNAQGCLLQ